MSDLKEANEILDFLTEAIKSGNTETIKFGETVVKYLGEQDAFTAAFDPVSRVSEVQAGKLGTLYGMNIGLFMPEEGRPNDVELLTKDGEAQAFTVLFEPSDFEGGVVPELGSDLLPVDLFAELEADAQAEAEADAKDDAESEEESESKSEPAPASVSAPEQETTSDSEQNQNLNQDQTQGGKSVKPVIKEALLEVWPGLVKLNPGQLLRYGEQGGFVHEVVGQEGDSVDAFVQRVKSRIGTRPVRTIGYYDITEDPLYISLSVIYQ